MQNTKRLLTRAENKFLKGSFDEALRDYGLALNTNPSLSEAKVGVMLSDLALESEDEAKALFDYYQVIKSSSDNADEIIDKLVESVYSSKNKIHEILLEPLQEQAEYEDSIRYSDFEKHIQSRNGFREAFEDIMFSTRVILTTKKEFISFVTKLIENDFHSMALDYLDNTAPLFGNDQEVLSLYTKLEK
ncbi:MAG: hypothetical protein JXQ76_09630 [Campylobacterales bacterium]|nr:hypothetical protein [Campylobacterales bacterium]